MLATCPISGTLITGGEEPLCGKAELHYPIITIIIIIIGGHNLIGGCICKAQVILATLTTVFIHNDHMHGVLHEALALH